MEQPPRRFPWDRSHYRQAVHGRSGIFFLMARQTCTADESMSGYIRLQSKVGDIYPNPAPAKFPIGSDGTLLGATGNAPIDALHFVDVDYQAPGKAVLEFLYKKNVALTVAPKIIVGIVFGLSMPYFKPIVFMDEANANLTLATEAVIGTITLSERSTVITHICGILAPSAGLTTDEEILGSFRLASDDLKFEPAQYPFSQAIGAGLGALIHTTGVCEPFFIPVDIPVPEGARVQIFGTLETQITKAVNASVFLGYEMG